MNSTNRIGRRSAGIWATALALTLALAAAAGAVAQSPGPVVVNAVDNDPANKLWNCETNRVPFGDENTDRSRCFTFHYAVPPEGIQSATVHIAINTLGSLQDTDATAIAVGQPTEPCAWGQGGMAGCVVVHGGFRGGEKSLNLDLLNLACDASTSGSPDAQRLVRDQLQTGVVHMILEDDTAVYSAQLVLNGGPASFACGTSTSEARTFIPPAGSGGSGAGAGVSLAAQQVNQLLTGVATPEPHDRTGAAVAAVAGAGLLALLGLSNLRASSRTAPAAQSRPMPATEPGPAAGGPAAASGADIGAIARDQAVDSLPDARDNAADLLIDAASERDKERRIEQEKRRLEAIVAARQHACDQATAALKQVIDRGQAASRNDYDSAQRAWQQAGQALQRAQADLQQFLSTLPAKPHHD